MDNHRILQSGDLVQWYRIEKVLGRGGFGVTYLATDTNLDHKVAVKEYMPGWAVERREDNSLEPISDNARRDFDQGVESFLREARTLVKFRHPNIVRVMAVFEANNTAYLVMEYEEGEEFKSYVQRGDGIDERSLKSLILRIADGLEQVHQYGFLHRDIKPVNLIIRKDGSPVLLDFGAARPTDGEAGAHTAYVSAGYTPIEQYQEGEGMRVGPWTDIYALGATLYYAISGKTPVGPTGRLAAMVGRAPDPLTPAVEAGNGRYSELFLESIDWALRFQPDQRPQDLSQWCESFSSDNPQSSEVTQSVMTSTQADRSVVTASDIKSPGQVRLDPARPGNRSSQMPSTRWAKWRMLASAAALLVVVFVGSQVYAGYQQRVALKALLSQADSEFEKGTLIDGALPLYQQVLGSAPDNKTARTRVAEIEELVRDRVTVALKAGDTNQADNSLTQLRSLSTDANMLQEFEQQIDAQRQRQAAEGLFNEAQSLVVSGQYQQAINMLDDLRAVSPSDARIAEIEATSRSALDEARKQQEQQERQARSAAQAADLAAAQARSREVASQQRIAAANKRQREIRKTYNVHLRQAENAMSEGDLLQARQSLDSARALQLSDYRLVDLEAELAEQEAYLRRPLSEYELRYASGQFNALKDAIGSKNVRSIESLSEHTPNRQSLFDTLFERYIRLEAEIINVDSALDPKRVTATLRIKAMIQSNGDIVYPSPAYRDTALTLSRKRYGWSRIIW